MPQNNESGNVFIFIMLGVALFAALAFTMSRGMRTQSTENISVRKAELATSSILGYVQQLERGIARLRREGVSENDISFARDLPEESDDNYGYEHNPPQPARNRLFEKSGGGVTWQPPPINANDGSSWHFTGQTCISKIGRGEETGCSSDARPNEELLAVLPNLKKRVCEVINAKLGIAGIPLANNNEGYSPQKFDGIFKDNLELNVLPGRMAGCFAGNDNQVGYHFYAVLMAR